MRPLTSFWPGQVGRLRREQGWPWQQRRGAVFLNSVRPKTRFLCPESILIGKRAAKVYKRANAGGIWMGNEEKRALAEQAYQKAVKCELDYGCCPQCVLVSVQEAIGIIDDQTIKASHGLSGGGGLMGEGVCGALAGGLLALSAKRGRDRNKLDKGRFIGNLQKGRQLMERFREEFGGVTCEELQRQFTGRTYDMWDTDEYLHFDRQRGNQCAHATGTVTRWVIEILGGSK